MKFNLALFPDCLARLWSALSTGVGLTALYCVYLSLPLQGFLRNRVIIVLATTLPCKFIITKSPSGRKGILPNCKLVQLKPSSTFDGSAGKGLCPPLSSMSATYLFTKSHPSILMYLVQLSQSPLPYFLRTRAVNF